MTSDSPLGRCPTCGTAIPSGRTLVEYERANGERRRFADCPECGGVVTPEK
ncbi:hypothetical protein [Halorubrum sp. BOL3-1]|uniref:DUF7837 family putative zinc-binding protein n=1 Tax=Halorubrum sp. BOL3-1 TaxID=2497325 RepID=UPI00140E16DE|nr:hypothetical protein [Halorubrum sp. BOL3-1]